MAHWMLRSLPLFWLVAAVQWRRQRVALPRAEPVAAGGPGPPPPLVSVIVPARDEAPHVERCLRSLLAQDYPHLEIVAVDDRSTDGTPAILARLARADARLVVVAGEELPDGWMGKAWAIHQGYRRARGDWLLFTDADTEHAPWLLASVMAHVRERRADFATVIGRQRQPTAGVYLANLAVFTSLYMAADFRAFLDPRSPQSLVNGQFVLFAREAYETVGTHAALRWYSSTDVALGYLAKLEGYAPLLVDGRAALETTMYRTFGEAFRGWSRSLVNGAWSAFGRGPGSLVLLAVSVGMAGFWLGPWMVAARAVRRGRAEPLAGAVLAAAAGVTVLRSVSGRWRLALRDAAAMPVSSALMTVMAATGLARAAARGGTVWKGRVVPTARRLPPWRPRPPRRR